ncbi:MAG: GNAT family N-acetyltransferase [Chloroflexi bacterium]|nr:GNAT family N-acetyltransferase [Chloroflexota bacterium]MCL5274397.1 GNAT family N-acetyltransferase [Chloroflexota bacterium]
MVTSINWVQRALQSEIEFSKALGGVPHAHGGFIHLDNAAVPWGGDFNCTFISAPVDVAGFEQVTQQVEQLHRRSYLERPDRYEIFPAVHDEVAWGATLERLGYRLTSAVYFCAPAAADALPPHVRLYIPSETEYCEWFTARESAMTYFDEDWFQRLLPLKIAFSRIFRPYWLLVDHQRVGWVYCANLGDYCRLFEVEISPEFRGRGYGKWLMQAIRQEGGDLGASHILLRSALQNFYEKCGFTVCAHNTVIRLRR